MKKEWRLAGIPCVEEDSGRWEAKLESCEVHTTAENDMVHREGWDLPECAEMEAVCRVKDEAVRKYLEEKGCSAPDFDLM